MMEILPKIMSDKAMRPATNSPRQGADQFGTNLKQGKGSDRASYVRLCLHATRYIIAI